jgi:hypothetical protein
VSRWLAFGVDQVDRIPSAPGVYALFCSGELHYVGMSHSLKHRLRVHPVAFDEVRIRPFGLGAIEHLSLEAKLINRLRPAKNSARSRSHDRAYYRTGRYSWKNFSSHSAMNKGNFS